MATSQGSRPRKLTLKQRRFVEALPTARSQTEAAIIAGYSNASDAASVRATELVRNSRVAPAIAAMQQATTDAAVATLHERKATLSAILREKRPGPYPVDAVISASDQLNKLERVYGETAQPAPTPTINIAVLLADPGIRVLLESLAERLAAVERRGER